MVSQSRFPGLGESPRGGARRSVRVLVMHVGEMQVAMGESVMAMAMRMARAAGFVAGVIMLVVLVVSV